MLSLAKTVFTNLITDVTVDYEITAERPFNLLAFIGGERDSNINKLESTFGTNGYYIGDLYYIYKNGVSIEYFSDNTMVVKLSGESMKEILDIYVKTMLVENTSIEELEMTKEFKKYRVTGDIVTFIDSLTSVHNFKLETLEVDGDYTHIVTTNLFNMIIEESDDVLEIQVNF